MGNQARASSGAGNYGTTDTVYTDSAGAWGIADPGANPANKAISKAPRVSKRRRQ